MLNAVFLFVCQSDSHIWGVKFEAQVFNFFGDADMWQNRFSHMHCVIKFVKEFYSIDH